MADTVTCGHCGREVPRDQAEKRVNVITGETVYIEYAHL